MTFLSISTRFLWILLWSTQKVNARCVYCYTCDFSVLPAASKACLGKILAGTLAGVSFAVPCVSCSSAGNRTMGSSSQPSATFPRLGCQSLCTNTTSAALSQPRLFGAAWKLPMEQKDSNAYGGFPPPTCSGPTKQLNQYNLEKKSLQWGHVVISCLHTRWICTLCWLWELSF